MSDGPIGDHTLVGLINAAWAIAQAEQDPATDRDRPAD